MVKLVKISLVVLLGLTCGYPAVSAKSQKAALVAGQGAHYEVTFKTSQGNIKLKLYNDTPVHRDNFAKLSQEGFYTHLIFHRVIRDFMIQTGDPKSREASLVEVYGNDDAGYKLDAEILPHYYHRKGVLAAAREGDDVNPERKSSGSQFYIVTGKVQNDSTLTAAREKIAQRGGAEITPDREEVYREIGGAPHLDGSYTIFGEVTDGLKVVEKISKTPTDTRDRPHKDVYITEVIVEVVPDKK